MERGRCGDARMERNEHQRTSPIGTDGDHGGSRQVVFGVPDHCQSPIQTFEKCVYTDVLGLLNHRPKRQCDGSRPSRIRQHIVGNVRGIDREWSMRWALWQTDEVAIPPPCGESVILWGERATRSGSSWGQFFPKDVKYRPIGNYFFIFEEEHDFSGLCTGGDRIVTLRVEHEAIGWHPFRSSGGVFDFSAASTPCLQVGVRPQSLASTMGMAYGLRPSHLVR